MIRLLLVAATLLSLCAATARVLIVCGEHPREHIGVRVCQQARRLYEAAHDGSLPAWLEIIERAVPSAYLAADPCRRTNDNGVDINRNWPTLCEPRDSEREATAHDLAPAELQRTWAGPSPLSEAETKAIDAALLRHRPDVVISIHSGARLLALPWFCSGFETTPPHHGDSIQLFRSLLHAANITDVPVVPAARSMYWARGTLCDWAVAERGVRHCVVAEIYNNPDADPTDEARFCSQYFGGVDTAGHLDAEEHRWAHDFLYRALSAAEQRWRE